MKYLKSLTYKNKKVIWLSFRSFGPWVKEPTAFELWQGCISIKVKLPRISKWGQGGKGEGREEEEKIVSQSPSPF